MIFAKGEPRRSLKHFSSRLYCLTVVKLKDQIEAMMSSSTVFARAGITDKVDPISSISEGLHTAKGPENTYEH